MVIKAFIKWWETEEGPKEEPEYVVKKIVDKRVATDGRSEYLIKWKGFAAKFDSWEP